MGMTQSSTMQPAGESLFGWGRRGDKGVTSSLSTKTKLRECVGCWEKSLSPLGEEKRRWGIGYDEEKQPFFNRNRLNSGLLIEVNHSPSMFERLPLGRDEAPISHGQWQHPQALCILSWKWFYPLYVSSTPPGCRPKEAARACAEKFP